jgi:hypothetical protein
MKLFKTIALLSFVIITAAGLASCANEANIAANNLKQAADNFGVVRRITVINGITDNVLLTVVGKCSQEQEPRKLAITCKLEDGNYVRNIITLGDNVTAVSEQLIGNKVSDGRYVLTFKPSSLIPSIDVR